MTRPRSIRTQSLRFGLGAMLALALAPTPVARASDDHGHSDLPHHHLAFFVGVGVEEKRDGRDKDRGLVTGLEYELRFSESWGVGSVVEALGGDTVREVSLVVPVSFHPSGGWRLFAGPGYEIAEKHDHWFARVGAGYEWHVGERWSLAPEVLVDFVDSGAVVYLGGIAIGYRF